MVEYAVKIGLIADVHANLLALKSVIDDMPSAELWICAGDVVGYYPDINDVCNLLRQLGALVIRGNHDAYVTGNLSPNPDRKSAYRTEWSRENLEQSNLAWLASLPVERTFQIGEISIRVRHASPWDEETYVYPDSSQLDKISLESNEMLVLGHTHHPMLVRCGKGTLINPGSVGQPRDWNPMASYAVLDTDTNKTSFHRVRYDVASLQDRLSKLQWDSSTVSILSRTR
jgi:putative phosphoesterase